MGLTNATNSSLQRRASLRAQKLSQQLAAACLGRENHAALVEVRAVRRQADSEVKISWRDGFTGESGLLGAVPLSSSPAAVPVLFTQLRAWRQRCENAGESQPARKAMRAGA